MARITHPNSLTTLTNLKKKRERKNKWRTWRRDLGCWAGRASAVGRCFYSAGRRRTRTTAGPCPIFSFPFKQKNKEKNDIISESTTWFATVHGSFAKGFPNSFGSWPKLPPLFTLSDFWNHFSWKNENISVKCVVFFQIRVAFTSPSWSHYPHRG